MWARTRARQDGPRSRVGLSGQRMKAQRKQENKRATTQMLSEHCISLFPEQLRDQPPHRHGSLAILLSSRID